MGNLEFACDRWVVTDECHKVRLLILLEMVAWFLRTMLFITVPGINQGHGTPLSIRFRDYIPKCSPYQLPGISRWHLHRDLTTTKHESNNVKPYIHPKKQIVLSKDLISSFHTMTTKTNFQSVHTVTWRLESHRLYRLSLVIHHKLMSALVRRLVPTSLWVITNGNVMLSRRGLISNELSSWFVDGDTRRSSLDLYQCNVVSNGKWRKLTFHIVL